jgi:hypothetical protein
MAVEAGAVASTAAEVGVSIARVEAADIAAAAPMAARGLSTGEATAAEALVAEAFVVEQGRATMERAGVRTADLARRAAWAEQATALNPAAIPLRWEIIRRISIPQSAMGNGIHSATAAIPHGSAADATPETLGPRASRLIKAEGPMVSGILLARPGALPRFAAALVSETRISADPGSAILLSPDHVPAARRSDLFPTRASDRTATHFVAPASIPLAATTDLAIEGSATEGAGAGTTLAGTADTATVGGEVLGTAMVGAATFSGQAILGRAGAGEVGASAWDGRPGRTDGIPGGTALTGIPHGLSTTTTRTTPATTIHRRTIPTMRVNTIRGQVTRLRRGWIRQRYISTSTLE